MRSASRAALALRARPGGRAPARPGEVLLALVASSAWASAAAASSLPAGGVQHLGEVAERVALHVQRVGAFGDRDGLAGELLGLGVVAAAGVDERLHLPPERLRRRRPARRRARGRAGRAARPRRSVRARRASGRAAARRSRGRPRWPRASSRSQKRRRCAAASSWRPAVAAIWPRTTSTRVVAGQLAPALAGLARDPGCLVEAGEHGQQPGAHQQRPGCGFSGRSASSVRSASSAGRGPKTSASLEAEEIRVALPGEAGVAERLLRRVRPVLEAAAEVRDPEAERVPDVHQAGVVLRLLEQRQRLPRELLELVDGRIGLERTSGSRRRRRGRAARLSRRRPPAPARRRRRRSRRPSRPSRSESAAARSSSSMTSSRAGRVSSSARSSSPAAARLSPRQSARRPAAASRSPARSASVGSGCPSSCL